MHCRFCYAGSRLEDTDVIDTNKIEQIIKILNRTNIKKVILLGGEPTLYKDLEKVIFQFKKNNIKVVLQTNGLVLTEARWKNLFTQIECSVSIKAFSEETYRRITGRKDYNNYEAIIRQVIKAYPFIQYTYVLDLFDKKMIDEIVRGIEKTGIKQILISSEQIDIENKNRSDIDLFEIWAIFIRKTHKPLFCCGHQPTASWELSSIYSAIRRNSSAYLNFTLMFPPS